VTSDCPTRSPPPRNKISSCLRRMLMRKARTAPTCTRTWFWHNHIAAWVWDCRTVKLLNALVNYSLTVDTGADHHPILRQTSRNPNEPSSELETEFQPKRGSRLLNTFRAICFLPVTHHPSHQLRASKFSRTTTTTTLLMSYLVSPPIGYLRKR